jgi:hypothetical protein
MNTQNRKFIYYGIQILVWIVVGLVLAPPFDEYEDSSDLVWLIGRQALVFYCAFRMCKAHEKIEETFKY